MSLLCCPWIARHAGSGLHVSPRLPLPLPQLLLPPPPLLLLPLLLVVLMITDVSGQWIRAQ